MKIELKNVKISQDLSEETTAYTATVYVNGQRAFTASNHGQGGSDNYWPVDAEGKALLLEAEAWAEALPAMEIPAGEPMGPCTLPMNLDLYISQLLEEWDLNEQIKRWSRKETVFRRPDTKPGAYLTVKAPYSPAVHAYIMKKYPDAEIIRPK